MKSRFLVRSAFAAITSAAALTLLAPNAQAALMEVLIDADSSHPTNVVVSLRYLSDSTPVTCKVIVKDLEAFGQIRAAAQIFTTGSGGFDRTFSFAPGHDLEISYLCTNRFGDSNRGTFIEYR